MLNFLQSPAFHFHTELHVIYYLVSRNSMKQFTSGPATPSQPNSPERKFSPEECAKLFKKDKTTPYSAQDITFVMEYAEKCHNYSNMQAIIREIKTDPRYSKAFKGKKVRTTLTRWIHTSKLILNRPCKSS